MLFTDVDLRQVQILLTAMKRAKYDDMHGEELLALAQVYQWVLALSATIQRELEEAKEKPRALSQVPPTPPAPAPVPCTHPIQKPLAKVIYLKDHAKKRLKKPKL